MANTLGIGKKYLRFFVENIESRWVMLQGGRRSGKSFAIHKWLVFLASGKPRTVGIVAASFPALQLAISDFQRATGLAVTGNAVFGYTAAMANGSRFLFRSFDIPEKCQGSTFDILYLEEVLNIPQQVVSVLSMSVAGQIYCAYNPTKSSFLDSHILPDGSNLLVTTFRDNPWLTPEQCEEFENIKRKAMLPTASLLDVYNYKVYYLGEFGSLAGKVFKFVNTCTDADYDAVPAPELLGLDFGFSASEQSDATALCGCKLWKGRAYFRQYIYSTQLASNKDLALKMADLGIDVYTPIVADYGGMGASRIRALVSADNGTWTEQGISSGFSVQNAQKGRILDGLNRMNQYELFVTESSPNLRSEMDGYELSAAGEPRSGSVDHAIDCCRYALCSYYLNFDYWADGEEEEDGGGDGLLLDRKGN